MGRVGRVEGGMGDWTKWIKHEAKGKDGWCIKILYLGLLGNKFKHA